jgi:hypothetical protein
MEVMSRSALARFGLPVAAILALTCFAEIASPFSGGITRKSGKQGGTCNGCHQGGVTPKVTLVGPTSLDAGMLATYTFRIETAAAITGMNAAISADDAVLSGDADGGTREDENEITHARTIRPDGGAAVYTFSMVAPPYGGKLTLYAAGNACNGNGNTEGDESAATSIEIDVNGPPRPPPPPPPSPQEPPSEPRPETPSSSGYGGDTKSAPPEDDSGCAVGWAGPRAPATSVVAALVAVAAVTRRIGSRRR